MLRSAVNLGSPITMRPFVALEVKLTPQSWNTVVVLRRRDQDCGMVSVRPAEEGGDLKMATWARAWSFNADDASSGDGDSIFV
jgi:hypothetical protein